MVFVQYKLGNLGALYYHYKLHNINRNGNKVIGGGNQCGHKVSHGLLNHATRVGHKVVDRAHKVFRGATGWLGKRK